MRQVNKINIKIRNIEFALEGDKEFIDKYSATIEYLLNEIENGTGIDADDFNSKNKKGESGSINSSDPSKGKNSVPNTFGELYQFTSTDISDTDKVLLAAYFIQSQSDDNSFKTREVTKTLEEQGIKPSNTSQCVKELIKQKKAFSLEKGKYRVGEPGTKYINETLIV